MWSEFKKESWESVPCIRGRQAIEEDVKLGSAVFYVKSHSEQGEGIYEIVLPHLAIWHDSEGGNLLATLEEFTFISSLEQLEKIDVTLD